MHRIGLGLALLILVTQSHASSSIVGGWHFGDFEYPGARRYVLTLFEDGVYYAVDNEFFNPARAPASPCSLSGGAPPRGSSASPTRRACGAPRAWMYR